MAKISIQDLAKSIAGKHGLPQEEAEAFVSALFDVINDGLHNEKNVKVKGLGTFKVIDVRERESVNINTGERVVIESHGKITFTPDPIMRDLVNKPFAQFDTVVLNDGVDIEAMGRVQSDETEEDLSPEDEPETTVEAAPEEYTETAETDETKPLQDEIETPTAEQETPSADEPEEETVEENDVEEAAITNPEPTVEIVSIKNEAVPDVEPAPVEDTPEEEEPDEEESETEEEVYNDEEESFVSRHRTALWSLLLVFVGVAALGIGYYWGRASVEPVVEYKTVHIMTGHSAPRPVKTKTTPTDTATTAAKKENVAAEQPVATPKPTAQPADTPNVTPSANDSHEMREAKSMVRTGAYNIIGTAETITVKRGETLKKISKFYLGDGMECYIKVHNGVTEVKEGMKLKIPKLKWKRKRNSD